MAIVRHTVLLADDHSLVRVGFRQILENAADIEVVAEAENGQQVLDLIESLPKLDVILMDISMPVMDGYAATKRLLAEDKRFGIVFLTVHDEPFYIKRALDLGCHGYLSKFCSADDILQAVRQVSRGQRYFEDSIAQKMMLAVEEEDDSQLASLSVREFEVFTLLVEGVSVKEIYPKLSLSPKTVETYRSRIFEKLGTSNITDLVKIALRHHVIAL